MRSRKLRGVKLVKMTDEEGRMNCQETLRKNDEKIEEASKHWEMAGRKWVSFDPNVLTA